MPNDPRDPNRFLAYSTFLNSLPTFPHLKHFIVPGPAPLLFQQQACIHDLETLRSQIDDDEATFRTNEEELERFVGLHPSPCLAGKEPLERVPKRMMRMLEALAGKMPELMTLGWWVTDVEERFMDGLVKWEVVREREGRTRLVGDERECIEEFKSSHTGWMLELEAWVGGEVEILPPDEEEEMEE